MPRLFTAIWLPPQALAELSGALTTGSGWPPEGWRPIPARRWHLTVGFHGDADPGVLARRLDSRLAGGLGYAPRLRLAGAVSFSSVLAAVVRTGGPADDEALGTLVSAAGGDPTSYLPHVTVARTARRDDRPPRGGPVHRFAGSWWRPAEVCLVRSEQASGAPRYTTLHRVPIGHDEAARTPCPTHASDHVVKPGTAGW